MVTIIGHTDLQQLPDAEIRYISDFLSPTLANSFFEDLTNHIPWRQDPITVLGKPTLNHDLRPCMPIHWTPTAIREL